MLKREIGLKKPETWEILFLFLTKLILKFYSIKGITTYLSISHSLFWRIAISTVNLKINSTKFSFNTITQNIMFYRSINDLSFRDSCINTSIKILVFYYVIIMDSYVKYNVTKYSCLWWNLLITLRNLEYYYVNNIVQLRHSIVYTSTPDIWVVTANCILLWPTSFPFIANQTQ